MEREYAQEVGLRGWAAGVERQGQGLRRNAAAAVNGAAAVAAEALGHLAFDHRSLSAPV